MTARQLLDLLVDPGTFRSWDEPVTTEYADPGYRAALARARERTGLDEAVLTGCALLDGRPVALVACEFGFLGGSIGVATAERITRAVERATAERLPLLALPVSGGTRMQEGSAAFLCMVRVTAAVHAHRSAGLPYLTYLRNPTMGGVFASWGTLGHLVLAEPGARLGFLGPRVYEELRGEPLPPAVQRAETLAAHGRLDAIVPPERLRTFLARALGILTARPDPAAPPASPAAPPSAPAGAPSAPAGAPLPRSAAGVPVAGDPVAGDPTVGLPAADVPVAGLPVADAWESVLLSRRPDRLSALELLHHTAESFLPLDGDSALVRGLALIGGRPVMVVAQQRRGADEPQLPVTAADLRAVRRQAQIAEELGLPLLTVVDTTGAELSVEAELDGVALEIAHCLTTLVGLRTPVLAVLLGQGSGGGALALLPADRVLAAQHAWLAPLPPEGASAIVHRDGEHAPQLARAQGITATDLTATGLVDLVVPETADPADLRERLAAAVTTALAELAHLPDAERLAARAARNRRLGGR
ncbi:putative acetyl-coenzyme A carboxylase carboxyl transferase subunit beta [Kitasatospora phosalacinea]|uniref:Acetyl-coenzyme A carboxylase carboxyl transferase subunits beta/alpha n=1 Tax=Kitasatospora phosalacinea TaxID=2065 RepID=A0A9W6Q1I3_9ACTN|nr:carboxyl transferase domain-containing protein [Kitasatospora phosalacinea]GLW68280.1 putative acetyl-coenzyme A carboxylase carboxyl transferase subunit beta [Kitasatospora phosalacinea]